MLPKIRRFPIDDCSMSRVDNRSLTCKCLPKLPQEIQEKIFEYLSSEDILNVTLVSKSCNFVVCNSIRLMSRYNLLAPNWEDLREFKSYETVMGRKFSSMTINENICFNYYDQIKPLLMQYGSFIESVTFKANFSSETDLVNMIQKLPKLTKMVVLNDWQHGLGYSNDAESLQNTIHRLNEEAMDFSLPLEKLKSLGVLSSTRLSLFLAARLTHLMLCQELLALPKRSLDSFS